MRRWEDAEEEEHGEYGRLLRRNSGGGGRIRRRRSRSRSSATTTTTPGMPLLLLPEQAKRLWEISEVVDTANPHHTDDTDDDDDDEDDEDAVVCDSLPPPLRRVTSPSSISTWSPDPMSPIGWRDEEEYDDDDKEIGIPDSLAANQPPLHHLPHQQQEQQHPKPSAAFLPSLFSPWLCVYDLDAVLACGSSSSSIDTPTTITAAGHRPFHPHSSPQHDDEILSSKPLAAAADSSVNPPPKQHSSDSNQKNNTNNPWSGLLSSVDLSSIWFGHHHHHDNNNSPRHQIHGGNMDANGSFHCKNHGTQSTVQSEPPVPPSLSSMPLPQNNLSGTRRPTTATIRPIAVYPQQQQHQYFSEFASEHDMFEAIYVSVCVLFGLRVLQFFHPYFL